MKHESAPPAELSDETLVARVVQRDVTAFTSLYDRYARTVYILAVHMVGHSEAEEAVQDIFLRLWNKADQFDAGRGSFKSWFMTVARHHLFDELRRLGQDRRLVAEKVDHILETAGSTTDLAEEVWVRERQSVVLQTLQSLPAEQRRAIVLAYFGGLSQSSIAQHMGWSLGTVKKRIRLGLQKLRAALVLREQVMEQPDGTAHKGDR